ncbi:hypothetical protein BN946_scf184573.g6 [Trametes cinnabarina]|uniref:Uncharacterized protein n=1 Tax=Pycnoporus cinnabarinus TaxID=5643 RepID=A0A060SDQ8_PYCCI|nr:hypothetical protein BN946_scf184573.g6 [Trametes cinnabarina]
MSKLDDTIPDDYPYEWTPGSQSSLQEFLAKWLWVRKSDTLPNAMGIKEAVQDASALLSEITERVEKIQKDPSIPIRSNKKKGMKSKKELREEAQREATEKLKEIAQKHGYVSGKWLIFAPPDRVDVVWNTIANSLVSGPLSSTSAYAAKVATSPQNDTPHYNHLLCVYMPDIYDQDSVTAVMRVLLREHGMNLMGVKSNLYTEIGIDSKHPSGIPSTVCPFPPTASDSWLKFPLTYLSIGQAWKNTALMKDTEIKALRDEYFAEVNAAKCASAEEATAKAATAETKKPKPKLKKKANDDPFGSDDEDEKDEDKGKKPASSSSAPARAKAKAKKPMPKTKAAADESASEDEGEAEAHQGTKKSAHKRAADFDSEGSETHAHKTKRGRS